jgi:hypothetical protein
MKKKLKIKIILLLDKINNINDFNILMVNLLKHYPRLKSYQ